MVHASCEISLKIGSVFLLLLVMVELVSVVVVVAVAGSAVGGVSVVE